MNAVGTVQKSLMLRRLNQFGLHPLTQIFASGKRRSPVLDVVQRFARTVPLRTTFTSLNPAAARRTG